MNNIRCPHCGLVNRLDALTCLRCKLALAQTAGSGQGAAAAIAVAMTMEEFAVERPLWVAVGLWGLKTRDVAWAFVVLSILVATGWIMYWSWSGAFMYLAAVWYFLAIRWVEKNSAW
ncbi:MAG: hypothetical protein H7Z16_14135 [Pyrinomonadaceae bacterium]|nr:hypothetical protein [Pyrinomonadaceae bacterium]